MKNKNLITISLPIEYHEKMRELGYTRKTLSAIIRERIDQDLTYLHHVPDIENLKEMIKIAKTPWIEEDED